MRIVAPDRAPRRDLPFAPAERAIFRLGGGTGLCADPLAVEERYDAALAACNSVAMVGWLRSDIFDRQLRGFRRLVPMAHAAFGMTPFDERTGEGLSANEALAALDRFFAFRDRVAGEFRQFAELAATYGSAFPPPAGYRAICGLHWNRRRVQALAGVAHYHAELAARQVQLHPDLADAMAATPAEALLIAEQFEADRAEAEARAEHQAERARSYPRSQ